MNPDFISQLTKKTGISTDQAASVGKIFDGINLADIGDPQGMISKIGKKVGLDEATSKQVYDTAVGFLGDNVLSKIKLPFGK